MKGGFVSTDFLAAVELAVASHSFGRPSAAKRGRRKEWPYVPIIDHGEQSVGVHRAWTEQARGLAYATRDEAIESAARIIEARRQHFREQLLQPRYRALREQYGLPREIPAFVSVASVELRHVRVQEPWRYRQ